MILDNLRTAGVQQAHHEDRRSPSRHSRPGPVSWCARKGRYVEEESGTEKRAAIFIGPEFGTVTRPDLVPAATRRARSSGQSRDGSP